METATNIIEQINAFVKNDFSGGMIVGYDIRDIPEFESVLVKGIENGETEFELIHEDIEDYGEMNDFQPEWLRFIDSKVGDSASDTEAAFNLKWHFRYDKEANLLYADVNVVNMMGTSNYDEVVCVGGEAMLIEEYIEKLLKSERNMTDDEFEEFKDSDEFYDMCKDIFSQFPRYEDFDFSSIRAFKAFEFHGKF